MSGTAVLSYLILTISMVYAFTMPFWRDLSILLDQKAYLQEQLDKARDIENKKVALLADFNQISDDEIKKIETLIPSSLNFVKLVADIDATASKQGIAIDRVSYADNLSNVASLAEAQIPQSHQSATIKFEFKATYAKFNDFLNDLERSLRILDIKSIQVTKGNTTTYDYRVEFETYWSK